MRFIKLKLNNITSLRGEHTIDFAAALGDEELFAITGPTGSGKSSLLTAISLALYGDTHKKLNQWEYVTQDEDEGSIDLEFSSNGINYRALWSCKKHIDKHGVLKPKYPKQLLQNGVPTDRPIEEVIGLNFDQFKKTIILNQGQFAEFLTATFTERKSILENLAGAEMLSQIGKNLKERVREMSRIQGELEARLEGGLPFSEEELKQMRQQIVQLEKQKPSLEIKNKRFDEDERDLKELLKWCSDIARYKGEDEGAKLELQSANDKLQKNKNEQREWQNEFDIFRAKRDQRRPQLQIAFQLEKDLDSKIVQEQSLANKDSERSRREKQWELECSHWNKRQAEIQHELETLVIDSDYEKLSELSLKAVEALMGEWDEALKKSSILKTKLDHSQERMDATQKRGLLIAAELEKLSQEEKQLSSQNISTQEIEKLRIELESLTHGLPQWEEYGRNIDDLVRRLKSKQKDLNDVSQQLDIRKDALKLKQLELENARLKKYQHELEHALGLIRAAGEEEGHCPACGHDWPETLNEKATIIKNINNGELSLERLNSLEREVAAEVVRLESLQSKGSDLTQEQEKLNHELKLVNDKKAVLEDKLSQFKKTIDVQILRELRTKKQEELKVLEEAVSMKRHLLENIKAKESERELLRKEWNEQAALKEQLEVEIKAIQNIIKRSYTDIKSRIQNLPEDFETTRLFIKKQSQIALNRERLSQEFSALQARLESGQKEANERAKDRNEDALQRTKLLQEIQHAQQTLKPLIPEGTVAKATKALEEQEDEWGQQKDKWNSKLKELEQKSETCRTKHSFISEQLKKARTELERTLALINSRKIPSEFDQDSGFARGLIKLKAIHQSEQIEAAVSEIEVWRNNFFAIEAKNCREQLKALETELIQLNKSLDIDLRKRKEMEGFKKELEIAQAQKKRWDSLAAVLGQDEFRGFALGLVEERLVVQTNRELEHLCEGRYQITLLENKKQSQDFLVVDHWRGGGERRVSTLSGGETFLVSLAMALSLAELTRGQTEVDAFFIDEGFGTLDRDSIDDVLDVLSNVRSRGKQIGLISHVKALTDRIPVNLHLEKSTLGDSKIKIVYN